MILAVVMVFSKKNVSLSRSEKNSLTLARGFSRSLSLSLTGLFRQE